MRHIVRLSLETGMRYYVDSPRGRKENDLQRIAPVVGRDGWYRNRLTGVEWFEYRGEAYLPRPGMHEYQMRLLNARRLTQRERAAYRELVRCSPRTALAREAAAILALETEVLYLRDIYREGLLRRRNRK